MQNERGSNRALWFFFAAVVVVILLVAFFKRQSLPIRQCGSDPTQPARHRSEPGGAS